MLKYCWTLHYNLPWKDISSIIHLINHSYCKLAINVTYMYVNINKKWIVPLQIFLWCITLYAFVNKLTRILSTLPSFQNRLWKLMYRYSMSIVCNFTTYLVFVASYTVSSFVLVVFSSRSCWWTNTMTSRTAFLVTWPGFCRAAKRTKFWAKNGQIQTVVTLRCFIRILSNFQFRVFE